MKQMKRHEKLLAAMLLSLVCLLMAIGDVPALAAADNPTDRQANRLTDHADIEELTGALETANTLEQVLARHKSVSVNMKLSFNGKKAFDMDWYITADSFYRAESDGFAYYRSADIYLETVGDNYSEIAMLLTDEAGYQEWLQDAFAGLPGLIEFPETEELVSVQEENGKLLVTSRQADAEILRVSRPEAGPGDGSMDRVNLMSPLVEVARDGETAKAMWYCPGVSARSEADGKMHLCWHYIRYAADFIREEGKWRLWHVFAGSEFRFEMGHAYIPATGMKPLPDATEYPQNPDTAHLPLGRTKMPPYDLSMQVYSIDYGWSAYPAEPIPYERFEDTFTYGPEPFLAMAGKEKGK